MSEKEIVTEDIKVLVGSNLDFSVKRIRLGGKARRKVGKVLDHYAQAGQNLKTHIDLIEDIINGEDPDASV